MALTPQQLVAKKVAINKLASDCTNESIAKELNEEGFPDYMTFSFVEAAKATKSIISSRLPGGVGSDLIEAGYDLKGFQIKAKSCDWGPMGGFICQLPFFNKYGYDKIGYNTGYIVDYLEALNRFSGVKKLIDKIQNALNQVRGVLSKDTVPGFTEKDQLLMDKLALMDRDSPLDILSLQVFEESITESDKEKIENYLNNEGNFSRKLIRNKIYKFYTTKIGELVSTYHKSEQNTAKWSGENSISKSRLTPFIPLKRRYQENIDALVKKLTDSHSLTGCVKDNGSIIGTAYNDIESKSTVKVELLLKPDSVANVWSIHYGDIGYRKVETAGWVKYEFSPFLLNTLSSNLLGISLKENLSAKERNDYLKYLNTIFKRDATAAQTGPAGKKYYPLCGILNPHPPYPEGSPDFYKNAVSGDFDLFAFWPQSTIPGAELNRLSERYLDQIFKFFYDTDMLFCIEFIPGFGELTQMDHPVEALKESAERGNISNLGERVSGMLNNIAMNTIKEYHTVDVPLNKAFHSDEGGRPGIMEIEFPIAIFFPDSINTTALNNKYTVPAKALQAFAGRSPINTYGGLIKTPEEFLQLLIDSNSTAQKFIIMMHAEWMIHIFYISMIKADRDKFKSKSVPFQTMFNDIKTIDVNGKAITDPKALASQDAMIAKKLDEFKKIDAHHLEIYPKDTATDRAFSQPAFEAQLKLFLKLDKAVDDNKFSALRNGFLKMAFQGKKRAYDRLKSIAEIIYDGKGDS